MVDVRHDEMASAIEALLLDDDGIPSVSAYLGGFNVFEAIGHTRSEERHSDFLAFLLDPNETHGLGAEVLRRFVVTILKSMRSEGSAAFSKRSHADGFRRLPGFARTPQY